MVANTTLVAAALDGLADQFLVGVGAVDLGGVDVGNAQVQGPVDGADRFGSAPRPDVVVAGHGHGAESYAGDVESAERDVLHDCLFLTGPLGMRQCRPESFETVARFGDVIA